MIRPNMVSGSQISAIWPTSLRMRPMSGIPRLIGIAEGLLEAGDDLVCGRELDPAVAPRLRACGHTLFVETARGILDEADAAPAFEEAQDRCVVTDVGRHAE